LSSLTKTDLVVRSCESRFDQAMEKAIGILLDNCGRLGKWLRKHRFVLQRFASRQNTSNPLKFKRKIHYMTTEFLVRFHAKTRWCRRWNSRVRVM